MCQDVAVFVGERARHKLERCHILTLQVYYVAFIRLYVMGAIEVRNRR